MLRLVVDVGEAVPDQSLRPFVESIEVVRGVKRLTRPIVAKPPHISLDGVDILLLFLGRIGVVEAQVAVARKFLRNPEIERDRLSVADMEVAVRFRRNRVTISLYLPEARSEVMRSRIKSRLSSAAADSVVVISTSPRNQSALLPNSRSQAKPRPQL